MAVIKTYMVVVNDEREYSIWPTTKPLPRGWCETGARGAKADCLAYIDEVSSGLTETQDPAVTPPLAPVTHIERVTCAVVAEVLGVDQTELGDNFFARGGNSLLAIRLLEGLRAVGLEASPRDVFEAANLAELASRLRPAQNLHVVPPNGIPSDAARITPEMLPLVTLDQAQLDDIAARILGGAANIQDIYPLTPLQEGFVFEHLTAKIDPYVTSILFQCDSDTDLDRFAATLERFVERHDILRTAIVWEARVQVVLRRAPRGRAAHRRDHGRGAARGRPRAGSCLRSAAGAADASDCRAAWRRHVEPRARDSPCRR